MASSGYEHGDLSRYNSELMNSQLERVLYTPWFKLELVKMFGPTADISKVRLWLGPCGCHWLREGKFKKYITVVFTYDNRRLALEQDDLRASEGVVRDY